MQRDTSLEGLESCARFCEFALPYYSRGFNPDVDHQKILVSAIRPTKRITSDIGGTGGCFFP